LWHAADAQDAEHRLLKRITGDAAMPTGGPGLLSRRLRRGRRA
jgi:hypothetical protein